MAQKQETLYYKGRPLVRSGNTLYYGHAGEDYVAFLQIMASKETEGVTLPSKVSVQLWSTDESLPIIQRIQNKAEKASLYEALALAVVWLERKERERAKEKA